MVKLHYLNSGNNLKLTGIIFDIDGTLISTNELIFKSFNHVTEKYLGKSFSDSEIIGFFGPTEDVILKDLMKNQYEEARKDYFDFYSSEHNELTKKIDGISELIENIKSRGIFLSNYTGKGKTSTEITLRKLNIYNYFDLIITGDDVEFHKPSPEGIEIFVKKFNLNRENVLMVGDAPADIHAAKNANIKIASVLWDSYAEDEVKKLGSDFYFSTVKEFSDFVFKNL